MNCEQIREQLGGYLDGELPGGAGDVVEAHLASCRSCRAEFASLEALGSELAARGTVSVPDGLWTAIERRLDEEDGEPGSAGRSRSLWLVRFGRTPLAKAAAVALAVGLGVLGLIWTGSRTEASTVNFRVLLDALPLDAREAFGKFLVFYDAQKGSPLEARQHAPKLTFEVPEVLPGGFRLETVYLLRVGDRPGVAATYSRNGEFLGTIFHPPVQQEDYGTHQDYPCVIGKHRGHKVEVDEWKLVHLTDPTTCHCILSRLNEETELPSVVAAVAPGFPVGDEGARVVR